MNSLRTKLFNLENKFSVPQAAFIIGIFTLLSRIIGLVRTRMFTGAFGAGDTLDIYYTAFRIPDFLTNILIVGTLSVAFLPVFTEYWVKDKKEALRFTQIVWTLVFSGMFVICGLGFVFAEPLSRLLVPGFSPESLAITVNLTRLIFVSQIIFSLSNLASAVINAHKRFLYSALAPIIYNIGIIAGLLFFYPRFGITGLGYGVILGAIGHFAVQLPELSRVGFSFVPRFELHHPGIKKMLRLYIPRMLAFDLSQISLLLASFFGSLLSAGSIAVFNLAFDIQAVPTGIFALSTAVAVFPLLSEAFSNREHETYWKALSNAITQTLFFIIPTTVFILLFRAYIVRLLYGTGNFGWDDTKATFMTLGIMTLALASQSLVPLFSRALFARHNTSLPVVTGVIAAIVHALLTWGLIAHVGGLSIAYGFVGASILQCVALYSVLRYWLAKESGPNKTLAGDFDRDIASHVGRTLIASLAGGVSAYGGIYLIAPLVNTSTGLGILMQSGVAGGFGVLVFFAVAVFLQIPESQAIYKKLVTVLSKSQA